MKENKGVALIAGLLIMAAVMALGVGSMFLAQMNLKIAENTRSSAVARYHAEAGLDTAVVLLKKIYTDTGRFPATFTLPVTSGQSYAMLAGVEGYRWDDANQIRVRVEGFTPNNARYIAEALLGSANIINPAFTIGVASMSDIRINGLGNAEFINAGVHSNTGLTLTGGGTDRFRSCPIGVTFASCPVVFDPSGYDPVTYDPYNMPGPYLPVTTSNQTNCYVTPWCRHQEKEIHIDVAYISRRNDSIATSLGFVEQGKLDPNGQPLPLYYRDANGNRESDGAGGFLYAHPSNPSTKININPETNPSIYNSRCDIVYGTSDPNNSPPATITSVAPGTRICAKNGLSLNFATGINMTGVTVVADGNITFGGTNNGTAGTLIDTKLISRSAASGRGGVMIDNVKGHNLTIFSGANRFNNNGTPRNYLIGAGFELTGNTTIASSRDITFEGKTQVTTYPTDPNRSPEVTVAIISSGTITNSGASDFYGIFWAGTGFEQSGTTKIFGAVASVGAVTSTGKFHINSSYGVNNSSLYAPSDVTVLSRR